MTSSSQVDRFGAFVSGSCAVHCIIASVAPILFTGLGVLQSESTEWALTGTAAALGLVSAGSAFRAGRPRPLVVTFILGIALLLTGRILEPAPGAGIAAIMGGVTLILAHLFHLRLARKSACQTSGTQSSPDQLHPTGA